jgi:serine/threonine-protein kinase
VSTSAATEDRLLGQTLAGKYQLIQIRARGAFGTVFLAHQFFSQHFLRPVAVKVSRQTGLTEATAPSLFSDAVVLARLLANAPSEGRQHLVAIHDLGLLPEHDGRGFVVLEYVDGAPLLAHIRAAGRVGVGPGLRYAREICRGLAVLHAQGAVHRDLKPDNLLVDRAGMVRLVDFGLASYTDPRLGFAPGVTGTLTYMAPETVRGCSAPAADVYSLGLILYELFTGGGPHLTAPWPDPGDDHGGAEHYRLKQMLAFPPPSSVHNEIRNDCRWLDGLILRCLATDPVSRFHDAGAVLAALEAGDRRRAPGGREEALVTQHSPLAAAGDELIGEARRLLARRCYEQVIDRLDVHRPAEWVAIDLVGARVLRLLAQAYLRRGDIRLGCDCLEQLCAAQREQHVLPWPEYAAALSDLVRCYQGAGLAEQAAACREEAGRLWQAAGHHGLKARSAPGGSACGE